MPLPVNGKYLLLSVVTFLIGVFSAALPSAESSPGAPNIFQPPVAARDESCNWVPYEKWLRMEVIRNEIDTIETSLVNAGTDKARTRLLERIISLRQALILLETDNSGDVYPHATASAKLVIREVCDEN